MVDSASGTPISGRDVIEKVLNEGVESLNADRAHTDSRNAEVVIHKDDSGSIVIDGPDGDISFSGQITDAIQAAIDAAPADGWHIHIAAGRYDIAKNGVAAMTDHIVINKPIELSGSGYATWLRVEDNTTDQSDGISLIGMDAGATGASLRAFRIDGNMQNNGGSNDGSVTDISGSADGHNIRIGLDAGGPSEVTMRGVWSVNSTGDGVEPTQCKNVTISNCVFKNNYEQHVHFNSCENVQVDNCILDNEIRNAGVIAFASAGNITKSCSITDSIIRSGASEGIKLTPGDGSLEDFTVSGCTVIGPDIECIVVTSSSAADNPPKDITIRDCTLKEGRRGLRVLAGTNITVEGVYAARNDQSGISVDANVGVPIDDVTIRDCKMYNNGVSSASAAFLLRNRDQTVSRVRFGDNDMVVTDADAAHDWGIKVISGTGTFDSCVNEGGNHINTATVLTDGLSNIGRYQGDATIPSGSTEVVVTHNLGKDPSPERFSVTPLGSMNGAGVPYVPDGNINSTSFRIRVDTAPSADVRLSWWIRDEA